MNLVGLRAYSAETYRELLRAPGVGECQLAFGNAKIVEGDGLIRLILGMKVRSPPPARGRAVPANPEYHLHREERWRVKPQGSDLRLGQREHLGCRHGSSAVRPVLVPQGMERLHMVYHQSDHNRGEQASERRFQENVRGSAR